MYVKEGKQMNNKHKPDYICTVCGVSIFNTTKEYKRCSECGGSLKETKYLKKTKEKKKWQ